MILTTYFYIEKWMNLLKPILPHCITWLIIIIVNMLPLIKNSLKPQRGMQLLKYSQPLSTSRGILQFARQINVHSRFWSLANLIKCLQNLSCNYHPQIWFSVYKLDKLFRFLHRSSYRTINYVTYSVNKRIIYKGHMLPREVRALWS